MWVSLPFVSVLLSSSFVIEMAVMAAASEPHTIPKAGRKGLGFLPVRLSLSFY